ncbi:hypothetical protein [Nitrospira sp. Ecomares 2.1]
MQAVLEDVVLGQSLLTRTTPRPLTLTVITDSRKFVNREIWRSFIRVLTIILHVECKLPNFSHAFFRDVRLTTHACLILRNIHHHVVDTMKLQRAKTNAQEMYTMNKFSPGRHASMAEATSGS